MAGTVTATTKAGKGRGVVRIDCAVTCAGGLVDAAIIGEVYGRLVAVLTDSEFGDGATMTATADILLTDATTGAPIFSDLTFADAQNVRPTQVITTNAGAAVAAATTANDVNRDIFVAGKLKLAIANATTTDTGLVSFIFEEAG